MGAVSLIVMEPGSEWPGVAASTLDVVALREREEQLASTTREKVDALRRSKREVRVAVLACNASEDPEATARRLRIAGALLKAVAPSGGGRLVLHASGGASAPLRRQLMSLTGALSEALPGTSATVSLKFGSDDDLTSYQGDAHAS